MSRSIECNLELRDPKSTISCYDICAGAGGTVEGQAASSNDGDADQSKDATRYVISLDSFFEQ